MDLPNDVIFYIALKLDLSDVFSFCLTSKKINKIVGQNKNFWITRLNCDHDVKYLNFSPDGKGDPKLYYEYLDEYIFCLRKGLFPLDNCNLDLAAKKGYTDIIKIIIENDATTKLMKENRTMGIGILNFVIRSSACEGHMDIVKLVIEKGAINFNDEFWSAAYGGNMDNIKLVIEKGSINFNDGLWSAAYGGHMDIVKLMVKKGADEWDLGLCAASYSGNIEIVKLMIKNGARGIETWNWGLRSASFKGHLDIVKLMLEKGADPNIGLRGISNLICYDKYNPPALDDVFYRKGKTGTDFVFRGSGGAAKGGHMKIVKLMMEEGADDWDEGLYQAAKGGHMSIVNLMIEKGADPNKGFEGVVKGLYENIVSGMIEHEIDVMDDDNWKDGFGSAENEEYMDIIKLMIEKGADPGLCDNDKVFEYLRNVGL